MLRPSGEDDLDSFDGVALGDGRRLVLQLAVDAERHHGTVGEQVESGLRSHEHNPIRARVKASRAARVALTHAPLRAQTRSTEIEVVAMKRRR